MDAKYLTPEVRAQEAERNIIAAAAVGTETSGSILFSIVAKFTYWSKTNYGLLSRTGIVPISSTLDTPGPMTKTLLVESFSAMSGEDTNDPATKTVQKT
jgi:amidase